MGRVGGGHIGLQEEQREGKCAHSADAVAEVWEEIKGVEEKNIFLPCIKMCTSYFILKLLSLARERLFAKVPHS